jgi:hypothetical protein
MCPHYDKQKSERVNMLTLCDLVSSFCCRAFANWQRATTECIHRHMAQDNIIILCLQRSAGRAMREWRKMTCRLQGLRATAAVIMIRWERVERRIAFGAWAALWRENKGLRGEHDDTAAEMRRAKYLLRRCVEGWRKSVQEAVRVEKGVHIAGGRELKRIALLDAQCVSRAFSLWTQLLLQRVEVARMAPSGGQYTMGATFATWARWLHLQKRVRAAVRLASECAASAGSTEQKAIIRKWLTCWMRWAIEQARVGKGVAITVRALGSAHTAQYAVMNRCFAAWARWALAEEGRVARAVQCVSKRCKAAEETALLRVCMRSWRISVAGRRAWIYKSECMHE